jgi:N-acetylglucosaminyldiphosphoundecaprenol N-acetyl-beta-D-mannosaminyltransferase
MSQSAMPASEPPFANSETTAKSPVWIWGVPFTPLTLAETIGTVGRLIEAREPTYFITANTHYAMLTETEPDLRSINASAAFIVADGAPLVWASRWRKAPLPERVAGADLILELSAEAARKGYRLFFLGGADRVAEEAARRLCGLFPGLQVAGTECPPFRELSTDEHTALIVRIRSTRPDLLMVAFTMPRGERWLAANFAALGVPVTVNVGAAIDFAANRIRRAPRWMQKSGLEWGFRLVLEPRRLFTRYARNAWFSARMVLRDMVNGTSPR